MKSRSQSVNLKQNANNKMNSNTFLSCLQDASLNLKILIYSLEAKFIKPSNLNEDKHSKAILIMSSNRLVPEEEPNRLFFEKVILK